MQQYFAKDRKDNTLYLNIEDLTHIKKVMRMKENDKVIVAYDDKSYICSLNKELTNANIIEVFKEHKKETEFIVHVPLLNEEKMSFIL